MSHDYQVEFVFDEILNDTNWEEKLSEDRKKRIVNRARHKARLEGARNPCGTIKNVQYLHSEAPAPLVWYEDYPTTNFMVTSNGMSGREWERHFVERDSCFSYGIGRETLSCVSEPPTHGVIYNVVVFRPSDANPRASDIHTYAQTTGWKVPHWEVGCLIQDALSDGEIAEMDFEEIITMHKPVMSPTYGSKLFASRCCSNPKTGLLVGSRLTTEFGNPNTNWYRGYGFAFVLDQSSTQ